MQMCNCKPTHDTIFSILQFVRSPELLQTSRRVHKYLDNHTKSRVVCEQECVNRDELLSEHSFSDASVTSDEGVPKTSAVDISFLL